MYDLMKSILGKANHYELDCIISEKNGDSWLTLGPIDINLYQDGSAELTIFVPDSDESKVIYNRYYPMIGEKEEKWLLQMVELYANKKIYVLDDSVIGMAAAIATDEGVVSLNNSKSIDFSRTNSRAIIPLAKR